MAQFKVKFLVINFKRLEELNENYAIPDCNCREAACPHAPLFTEDHPAVNRLISAVNNFNRVYEKTWGKKMNQKYYVCNQDEPYAKKVIDTILEGEDAKGR